MKFVLFIFFETAVYCSDLIFQFSAKPYFTNSCPEDNGTWTKRGKDMKCSDMEPYHCDVLRNGTLVEGCHRPFIIKGTNKCLVIVKESTGWKYVLEECEGDGKCPFNEYLYSDELFTVPGCYGNTSAIRHMATNVTYDRFISTTKQIQIQSTTKSYRLFKDVMPERDFAERTNPNHLSPKAEVEEKGGSVNQTRTILLFTFSTLVAAVLISSAVAVLLLRKCRKRKLRKHILGQPDGPLETTEDRQVFENELNVYNEVGDAFLVQDEATCSNQTLTKTQELHLQDICGPNKPSTSGEEFIAESVPTSSLTQENVYYDVDDTEARLNGESYHTLERCPMLQTKLLIENVNFSNVCAGEDKPMQGNDPGVEYMEPVDSKLHQNDTMVDVKPMIETKGMFSEPIYNPKVTKQHDLGSENEQESAVTEFENRVYHSLEDSKMFLRESSMGDRIYSESTLSKNTACLDDMNSMVNLQDDSEVTVQAKELHERSIAEMNNQHSHRANVSVEIGNCCEKADPMELFIKDDTIGQGYYQLEIIHTTSKDLNTNDSLFSTAEGETTLQIVQSETDKFVCATLSNNVQESTIIHSEEYQIYHEIGDV